MEELRIIIPENQEIDWQESGKQKKIIFKDKVVFRPKSWEEYCNNTKYSGYYIAADSTIEYIEDKTCHLDDEDKNLLPTEKLAKSFLALMQLISLRQAWVGDWKPNWAMHNSKYAILFVEDKLIVTEILCNSRPLSFPTKEMAEEFAICFKDLIEEAKPLL